MRVWRGWIWPGLKWLIVAVIAVSLVKIAFFPNAEQNVDPGAVPTGQLADPVVSLQRGSIVNTLTVTGQVAYDKAAAGKSPLNGEIVDVFVQVGSEVIYGETVASIRQVTEREPIQNADGTVTEVAPDVVWDEIIAPATGVVSALNVIGKQQVSVGEVAVQVVPTQLLVSGTIPPVQRYRLASQPNAAEATITQGPAPFTCTDLKIGSTLGENSGSSDTTGQQAPDTTTTPITCRIPLEVQAFPGVEATLTIEGGRVDDVLTLPVTAVKGQAGSGIVTVTTPEGAQEERAVTLGLSDGTIIEITGGLAETDSVLEFFPGAQAAVPEGCVDYDAATATCYSYGAGG